MGVQIGLVGQRADLALEVAELAARVGASVLSLGPADVLSGFGGALSGSLIDIVLVDVAVVGGGMPDGSRGTPDSPGTPWAPGSLGAPGVPVVVLYRAGEGQWAREVAFDLGSAHVVELPVGAPWLVSQLAPERGSRVLGVVGAVGGVGATTIAIACAAAAGPDCLLVDADPDSAGLDLPLGIGEGVGVRWSDIPDTVDPLDPGSLRSALPAVGEISVVTGPGVGLGPVVGRGPGGFPGSGRLAGVLGVGRAEYASTVVDAGRGRLPGGLLGPGDPVALVLPATLAGIVAGRRMLAEVPGQQVVVLLRPTGWLPAEDVAEQLGFPVALEIPRLRRAAELADCGDLLAGRTGRALRNLGEQIWGHLG